MSTRLDYSREALSSDMDVKAQEIYNKVRNLDKRAYNRGVAPFIIDTFLDFMEMEDPEEFLPQSGVLTWIAFGMFDSSANHLESAVYPNLTSEGQKLACSKLIQMLRLADDYPKTEEPEEENSEETETQPAETTEG